MGSALVYKRCSECLCLRRVDLPKIHRMGSTLVYKGCGESLRGVEPSRIHRMGSTLSIGAAVNP